MNKYRRSSAAGELGPADIGCGRYWESDVVNATAVVASGTPAAADLLLAHEVRRALEWDSVAPDERIQTTISNGWVTLQGSVDHMADGMDAERAVRGLVDVKGVTNLIEVGWIGNGATGLRAC